MNASRESEAVAATCLWLCHDHESCIQTLQRLELVPTLCDCHLKVQHNLAVVEHYNSKRKDPARLLEQLTHLVHEASSKATELLTPAPSARGLAPPAVQDALVPVDADVANLKVNKALLLYQGQQYEEASHLLGPVLQQLEGLDEGTALHALLLQLDMHLHTHNVHQAALVLAALEKACPDLMAGFADASGSTAAEQQQQQQQQRAGLPSPTEGTRTTSSAPPPSPSASTTASAQTMQPAAGVPDAAYLLPYVSQWGSGAMQGACALLQERGGSAPAPPNLLLLAKLYRVRLALLQGNLRGAKRELRAMLAAEATPGMTTTNSMPETPPHALGGVPAHGNGAVSAAPGSGNEAQAGAGVSSSVNSAATHTPAPATSTTTALCRAHLQLLRGSCRKAAHILTGLLQDRVLPVGRTLEAGPDAAGTAVSRSGQGAGGAPLVSSNRVASVLLNNLGIVHHFGNRHQLSALCFRQASDLGSGPDSTPDNVDSIHKLQTGLAAGADTTPPAVVAAQEGRLSHQTWAVAYNLGAQYAALGQFEVALQCFARCITAAASASGLAAHRPLLLLRAAQAALGLHQQQQQPGRDVAPTTGETPPAGISAGPASLPPSAPAAATAPLSQALVWLQAALEAMETWQQLQQGQVMAASAAAAACGVGHPAMLVSTEDAAVGTLPESGHALEEQTSGLVHQSILSHLAYVHLLLGESDAALAAATQLLALPNLAPSQAQAAACYAAEVLAARGRDAEAVTLMSTTHQAAAVVIAAAAAASQAASFADGMQSEQQQQRASEGAGSETASTGAGIMHGVSAADVVSDPISRSCHAALCSNLSCMLLAEPASSTTGSNELVPPLPLGPAALVAEALEQQPGCIPAALMATYLDMMSGQCDAALGRIRAMQL